MNLQKYVKDNNHQELTETTDRVREIIDRVTGLFRYFSLRSYAIQFEFAISVTPTKIWQTALPESIANNAQQLGFCYAAAGTDRSFEKKQVIREAIVVFPAEININLLSHETCACYS